jgi:hypothetical protein
METDLANLHQVWSSWAYTALTGLMVVVLYFQLNGLKNQVRSTALQGIWTTWIEIDRWFVSESELRPFFYVHGYDTDAAKHGQKLEAACEMLLDCYAHIFAQRHVMRRDFEPLSRYMREVYKEQPVFRRFTESAASWYDPKFVSFLRNAGP